MWCRLKGYTMAHCNIWRDCSNATCTLQPQQWCGPLDHRYHRLWLVIGMARLRMWHMTLWLPQMEWPEKSFCEEWTIGALCGIWANPLTWRWRYDWKTDLSLWSGLLTGSRRWLERLVSSKNWWFSGSMLIYQAGYIPLKLVINLRLQLEQYSCWIHGTGSLEILRWMRQRNPAAKGWLKDVESL